AKLVLAIEPIVLVPELRPTFQVPDSVTAKVVFAIEPIVLVLEFSPTFQVPDSVTAKVVLPIDPIVFVPEFKPTFHVPDSVTPTVLFGLMETTSDGSLAVAEVDEALTAAHCAAAVPSQIPCIQIRLL